MSDSMKALAIEVIRSHIVIPSEIARRRRQCNGDLLNGPDGVYDDDYPGFTEATKEIRDWNMDNLPQTLFLDMSVPEVIGESSPCNDAANYSDDSGTEEYCGPAMEDVYEMAYFEIVKAVYGANLVTYVG